jgi:hypothetical protein
MKKLLCCILTFLLVLTGCGSNSDKKSEEALRAEIRAEVEAEQKAKDEMKDELEDNKKDVEKQEVENDINIKDKKNVLNFVFQEFNIEDNYSIEKRINELTFTYDDFNNDGTEDVVVYSSQMTVGFQEVAFVCVRENGYDLIDNQVEAYGQYENNIAKEGNFIIYRGSGGGTGTYTKYLDIYRYVDGEIVYTDSRIDLEGHDTGLDGQPIKVSSEVIDRSNKYDSSEDKWFAFEYIYMKTDNDDKLIEKTSKEYVYNSESNTYEVINQLETKNDAKDEGKKQLITNGKYDIEQLMGIGKLEDFVIKDVSYDKLDEGYLELEGKISLKGRITRDDLYGGYNFFSDEVFLDYPIKVGDNITISNYIEFAEFNQKAIKQLSKSEQKLLEELEEKGALEVACTINNIKIFANWEGQILLEFDNIEVLSDTTSEKSGSETSTSKFENEMLFSEDEEIYIDYSKHCLVIIPQQNSVNDDKLGNRTVELTDSGNEFASRFAVIGEAFNVEIIYHENPLVEGSETKTVKLKDVKNEIVTVKCKMPYDQSHVEVKGAFNDSPASVGDFSISLDSVRDNTSYKILTFDYTR